MFDPHLRHYLRPRAAQKVHQNIGRLSSFRQGLNALCHFGGQQIARLRMLQDFNCCIPILLLVADGLAPFSLQRIQLVLEHVAFSIPALNIGAKAACRPL